MLVKSRLDDAGWWEGVLESTGRRGMFPNNFVDIISDQRGSLECMCGPRCL